LALVGLLIVSSLPGAQAAQSEDHQDQHGEWWAQLDANVALLNGIPGRNMLPNEFGYGARLGHRWERWGVFGQLTHNLWVPNREGWTVKPGVLNAGLGVEHLLFDNRVRISAAAGTSTLVFETVLDAAGTTGFFVEVRPAGLRWNITDRLRLEWDPITFSLSQPALDEPTLDQTEFKTVFVIEVGL
jgi:hypothetical protein